MRSKKELMNESKEYSNSWGEGIGITRRLDLLLEVLLDIRDALNEEKSE